MTVSEVRMKVKSPKKKKAATGSPEGGGSAPGKKNWKSKGQSKETLRLEDEVRAFFFCLSLLILGPWLRKVVNSDFRLLPRGVIISIP
jgi:hypothetical protein